MDIAPKRYFDRVPWQVLAAINHSFLLSERKRHFLRYIGGLLYTEISVPAAFTRVPRIAAQRLGFSERGRAYWDLHIKEDERHGRWMLNDIALPLAAQLPAARMGARARLRPAARFSERAGAAVAAAAQEADRPRLRRAAGHVERLASEHCAALHVPSADPPHARGRTPRYAAFSRVLRHSRRARLRGADRRRLAGRGVRCTRRAWGAVGTHVGVDPQYRYLNGKVNGVHTGVALAAVASASSSPTTTFATCAEDVERRCASCSRAFELVRPQNYLSPLPWWARLEAARMLINRGVLRTGDYPGTCGIATQRDAARRPLRRRRALRQRRARAALHREGRATSATPTTFFILKRPPTLAKWREQRPRQAYEDFVMRAKTVTFMCVIPLAARRVSHAAAAAVVVGVTLTIAAVGHRCSPRAGARAARVASFRRGFRSTRRCGSSSGR